jgi:hypothetical protein
LGSTASERSSRTSGVRFERTDRFRGDYRRLSEAERGLFDDALRRFASALEANPGGRVARLPGSLRVKPVGGAKGIFELTWSFAGPDGRATFEYRRVSGELTVLLRRVGGHAVFREP